MQRSFIAAIGKPRNPLKQDSLPAKVKPLGLQEAGHSSLYLKKKSYGHFLPMLVYVAQILSFSAQYSIPLDK